MHGRGVSSTGTTLPSATTGRTVELEDRDRNLVSVTPGVLDDDAKRVYTEGQCVALAVAVAEHLGSNQIVVMYSYAGEGDDATETMHHAWALSPDATSVIDVRGATPVSEIAIAERMFAIERSGRGFAVAKVYTTRQARGSVASSMDATQDFDTATSFAEEVAASAPPSYVGEPQGGVMRAKPGKRPFEVYHSAVGWARF